MTINNEYIEKHKRQFLPLYEEDENFSKTIEKEFYNKEMYNASTKIDNNDLENKWMRRMLIETTPRGNIYMYYNPYKLAFSYYADESNIPYNILNAVAMKYCRLFHCLDFFVDENIIPDGKTSPLIKILHKEEKKKKEEDTNSSVKNKTIHGPFIKHRSLENTYRNKAMSEEEKEKERMKEKEKNRISNKFVNVGKVYQLDILNRGKPQVKTNFNSSMLDNLKNESQLQDTVMDYKKYKELINSAK